MNVMYECGISAMYCIFIMKSPINNLTSSSIFGDRGLSWLVTRLSLYLASGRREGGPLVTGKASPKKKVSPLFDKSQAG
jgi:hypothetical protein